MPTTLPGEQYIRYNSLVNNVANPFIFVIQHSSQAYRTLYNPGPMSLLSIKLLFCFGVCLLCHLVCVF